MFAIKDKFKILFLTHCYPDENGFIGGLFEHSQAIALKKSNVDIAVLYLDMRSIRRKRILGYSKYELNGINVYRIALPIGPFYSIISKIAPFIALKMLKKISNEWGCPDLIHAHFADAGLCAKEIFERTGIPYVLTEHSSGLLNGFSSESEKKRVTEVYQNAKQLISVGNVLRKQIYNLTKIDSVVIPNVLPSYMSYRELRKHTKDFCFVSTGNLIKRKNFELTIRAFCNLIRRQYKAKLIIIGTGPEKDFLISLVRKNGLGGFVEFKDSVSNSELPDIYSKCDCFVLPSMHETFGVVYAEALACGLPVIATMCGGPEDFIDRTNGMLIECNNEEALTKAMIFMLNNKALYNSKEISSSAREKFSETNVAENIISLYKGIIK